MKHPSENAERWMQQADYDLAVAKSNLNGKFYADVCFKSEQSAQKALKAYLYLKGARFVADHAIEALARRCMEYDDQFEEVLRYVRLDQYYLPTRYPDAIPYPGVPYKSFSEDEARQALRYAEKILQLVRNKIK